MIRDIIRKYGYIILGVLTAIAIISAVINTGSSEGSIFISGYAVHFIAFFALSAVLLAVFKEKMPDEPVYLLSLGYCLVLAIWIEIIQRPIPYREFDIIDILFGFLGSAAMLIIAKSVFLVRSKK